MGSIIKQDQLSYLGKYNSHNDPLLSKMEKFAEEHNIPILDNISALFLEQMVQLYKPNYFLEIGTAIGYSTIRVANVALEETNIYTIEHSLKSISVAKTFINEANLTDKIEILEGDANILLQELKIEFDFIFLDADKEDYQLLFEHAFKILKKGGVILVDNLLWHGYAASKSVPTQYKKSTEFIRKFNAQFLSHPNLKSSLLPIGDGLGLGIKI